jgi:hypothetical protein
VLIALVHEAISPRHCQEPAHLGQRFRVILDPEIEDAATPGRLRNIATNDQ